MNITDLNDNINKNRHFSLARYQDGEIIAMIKHDWIHDIKATSAHPYGNCDGHLYFDEMCNGLYDSICTEKNVPYSNINKYIFRISIDEEISNIENCDNDIICNCDGKTWWRRKKTSRTEVLKMLYNLKENIKVKITYIQLDSEILINPTKIIDFIDILNIKNYNNSRSSIYKRV